MSQRRKSIFELAEEKEQQEEEERERRRSTLSVESFTKPDCSKKNTQNSSKPNFTQYLNNNNNNSSHNLNFDYIAEIMNSPLPLQDSTHASKSPPPKHRRGNNGEVAALMKEINIHQKRKGSIGKGSLTPQGLKMLWKVADEKDSNSSSSDDKMFQEDDEDEEDEHDHYTNKYPLQACDVTYETMSESSGSHNNNIANKETLQQMQKTPQSSAGSHKLSVQEIFAGNSSSILVQPDHHHHRHSSLSSSSNDNDNTASKKKTRKRARTESLPQVLTTKSTRQHCIFLIITIITILQQ
eukprot:m.74034 g.74034  ORF g.74034 m.74034 type:complete len:296 (-) comp11789_c0_seq1:16-903(-)